MVPDARKVSDEEILEAANDLVAGTTTRWRHAPHDCALIVAHALAGIVAKQHHETMRDHIEQLMDYHKASMQVLIDIMSTWARKEL